MTPAIIGRRPNHCMPDIPSAPATSTPPRAQQRGASPRGILQLLEPKQGLPAQQAAHKYLKQVKKVLGCGPVLCRDPIHAVHHKEDPQQPKQ
jgi:hypothetical protein